MGRAFGLIVATESKLGISGLTVSAKTADIGPSSAVTPESRSSISLGTAVTDRNGRFSIQWNDEASGDRSQTFSLGLEVVAPFESGDEPTRLHIAPAQMTRLSAQQEYFIRIPTDALKKSDIPLPGSRQANAAAIQSIRDAANQAEELEKEWREVAETRLEKKRETKSKFLSFFRPQLMRDISRLPDGLRIRNRLVVEGDDERTIDKLTKAAIRDGVEVFSRGQDEETDRLIVKYRLNPEQKEKLDELLEEAGDGRLTEEQMLTVLRHGTSAGRDAAPVKLSAEGELFEKFFMSTHAERCAADALAGAEEEDAESDEGNGEGGRQPIPEKFTNDVINTKLFEVVQDISSPLGILAGRPGQDDLLTSIQNFALSPGPADEPAFFDFNKLYIAFDHVWKEFIDERIEPLALEAYHEVVEQGGEPDPGKAGVVRKPSLSILEQEEALIARAGVSSFPVAAYAHNLGNLNVPGLDNGPGLIDPDDWRNPKPTPEPMPPPDNGGGRNPIDPGYTYTPPADGPGVNSGGPKKSLTKKLRDILNSPYSFTAFGADENSQAINFGINITYRQRWEPVTYQVGELRHTITLAPGESRKYTRRTKVTRKRSEKEVEKNISLKRDEFDTKTRAETAIIRKAESDTNFQVTTDGTYNILISRGDSESVSNLKFNNRSDDTKKSFREAVIKAANEYRQERTLDISTEDTFEQEDTESGEINNPNNELTVTYLFYELQRRFRISEQIYSATPTVLVAQDLPSPDTINEAFLIRHAWIFKRAALDDKYLPILDYVSGPLAGDITARNVLWQAKEDHRQIVFELKNDLYAMKEQASEGYEALRRAVEARIQSEGEEESDGLFMDIVESFVGGGQTPDAARAREEAARAHEQRAVEQVKALTMALQREISAYTEATEKYVRAQKEQAEWDLKILDLLVHVKDNIIHYMQAVWAHEHPDQRFLRLHQVNAPSFVPTDDGGSYSFVGVGSTIPTFTPDGQQIDLVEVEFDYAPKFEVEFDTKSLSEIADLDRLLGFKGNYLIFALKESNPLTDFLLAPYLDAGLRLMDPHDPGNVSREDFARYVCYLRETLSDQEFEDVRPSLLARFKALLLSSIGNGDELIVPTGSAYIEALPGANPLLEDFKLAHRALDVVSAQEEARHGSLDSLRRAARILGAELEDPDIEAKYLFQGNSDTSVVAPPPHNGGPDNDD